MTQLLSIFAILLLLLSPLKANSIEVTDLYTARVEITDKSPHAKNIALKKAMSAVLMKVGGKESLLKNPTMVKGLSAFKKYYLQTKYVREAEKNMLVVTFNPQKINQLFIQANLPLWGSLRPNILVFLIVEDGLSRQMLYSNEELYADYQNDINAFASSRGLPLLLPSNNSSIDISDIWGRFSSPIINIAKQYEAEASIIIRLSNSSLLPSSKQTIDCTLCQKKNFAIDWGFLSDSTDSHSLIFGNRIEGTQPNKLIKQALKEVTEKVYDRYAPTSYEQKGLIINVANVKTLLEYSQVRSFLESLTSVVSVTLSKVNGEGQYFKLSLIGTQNTFLKTLKLNNELQQYVDPLLPEDSIPVFYWRKQ